MKKTKKGCPRTKFLKFFLLFAAVGILYLLVNIPVICEHVFARGITRWCSWLLNRLTNYISVSFYEWTALILIIGAVVLLVFFIVLLCKKRFARLGLWLYRLAIAGLSLLFAFGILYAPLYERDSAVEALELSDSAVTEKELYSATKYYVRELNAVSARIERDADGNVIPPYSFEKLSDLLNEEFKKLDDGYFADYGVRPKKVVLSVPMSYLGITGIYIPFYAEANVNVNIPAFELPNTMAHEMAHAKGVSRENEANVVSYVLCIRSDDAYLNYSGLMRAAANLLNALSPEEREKLKGELAPEILLEYRNESEHYAKYDGFIDRISSWFNNLFLKANGVSSGTRSYGEVTRSLVALYKQISEEE